MTYSAINTTDVDENMRTIDSDSKLKDILSSSSCISRQLQNSKPSLSCNAQLLCRALNQNVKRNTLFSLSSYMNFRLSLF